MGNFEWQNKPNNTRFKSMTIWQNNEDSCRISESYIEKKLLFTNTFHKQTEGFETINSFGLISVYIDTVNPNLW